ncbi:MAG: Chemotaxis response regulator protein-glutamate methylesterase [Anaerolineales bacterium]|nr:Chemotaxis response regulator protein-glutamate methylesterase [Anaerolineales bacterium]
MAGEKIRVLIVDDVAETRENVRKLLQFETDVEVAGTARSGNEGIQLAGELDPDVILMDINMPDVDGITATEQVRQKMPHVQVVILSVQGDQNYMRRAMLAGARDFLTKPPMGDELISAVRRAGEMARSERAKGLGARVPSASMTSTLSPVMPMGVPLTRGKVVTVYSPKGGTGCTTVAVNLALALHNDDTRAVIVDGNLQYGDVAIFFNEQGKNTVADLAPRADELELEVVEGVLLKHAASGVHILAAPTRLEQAEKVSADQFTKIVEYLRQLYAYVIVDVSGHLSEIAIAAIDLSDAIVLLTTQDIPAVKNARQFLDVLQTLGVQRERMIFVMNRYDKRIPITPERVGENLKQEVLAVIPLDERAAIPAINQGVPFMVNNKTLPAARGIYSLAELVRARVSAREDALDRPVKR